MGGDKHYSLKYLCIALCCLLALLAFVADMCKQQEKKTPVKTKQRISTLESRTEQIVRHLGIEE